MSEKRKRKVTDPFQLRIFFRILSYGLIYQLTAWNLMFCWQFDSTKGSALAQYRDFFLQSYPMLICVLILAPAFAWDAVKYCHRVAGPIYRIRTTLRLVAAGKPVPLVRLRAEDELLGLQDDCNLMLNALAGQGAITLAGPPATVPPIESMEPGLVDELTEPAPLR